MIIVGYVVKSVDVFRTNGLCYNLMSFVTQQTALSKLVIIALIEFDNGNLIINLRSFGLINFIHYLL